MSPAWSYAGECGVEKCYTLERCPEFQISDEENLYVADGDENRLLAGWKPKPCDFRKYSEARDGDDLMILFECNFCVFCKVTGRLVDINNQHKDRHLMGCIRRLSWMLSGVGPVKL